MSEKNYYDILGVPRTATGAQIKAAYIKKARLLHPDQNKGREAQFTPLFQEVSNAYDVLSDPHERQKYDAKHSGTDNGYSGASNRTSSTPYQSQPKANSRDDDEKIRRETLYYLFRGMGGKGSFKDFSAFVEEDRANGRSRR